MFFYIGWFVVVVFRTFNLVYVVIFYIFEKNLLEFVYNVVLNLNLIFVMIFFKILVRIKRLNCEIIIIYLVYFENFFVVGKVYF